ATLFPSRPQPAPSMPQPHPPPISQTHPLLPSTRLPIGAGDEGSGWSLDGSEGGVSPCVVRRPPHAHPSWGPYPPTRLPIPATRHTRHYKPTGRRVHTLAGTGTGGPSGTRGSTHAVAYPRQLVDGQALPAGGHRGGG